MLFFISVSFSLVLLLSLLSINQQKNTNKKVDVLLELIKPLEIDKKEKVGNNHPSKESSSSSEILSSIKEENQYLKKQCEELQSQIRKNTPSGERYLTKIFCDLYSNPFFKEMLIYHSLSYIDNNNCLKEIDFLVLTKKGLLIIESKHWKGVTHIYCNNQNESIVNTTNDLFFRTHHEKFFLSNINIYKELQDMRIFVVKENDKKGSLIIQNYGNPIMQVRDYSQEVSHILKRRIINSVVFHSDVESQIVFNNEPISKHKKIDNFTNILVDTYIGEYLQNLDESLDSSQIDALVKVIEENFKFNYKMSYDNCSNAYFRTLSGNIP